MGARGIDGRNLNIACSNLVDIKSKTYIVNDIMNQWIVVLYPCFAKIKNINLTLCLLPSWTLPLTFTFFPSWFDLLSYIFVYDPMYPSFSKYSVFLPDIYASALQDATPHWFCALQKYNITQTGLCVLLCLNIRGQTIFYSN